MYWQTLIAQFTLFNVCPVIMKRFIIQENFSVCTTVLDITPFWAIHLTVDLFMFDLKIMNILVTMLILVNCDNL